MSKKECLKHMILFIRKTSCHIIFQYSSTEQLRSFFLYVIVCTNERELTSNSTCWCKCMKLFLPGILSLNSRLPININFCLLVIFLLPPFRQLSARSRVQAILWQGMTLVCFDLPKKRMGLMILLNLDLKCVTCWTLLHRSYWVERYMPAGSMFVHSLDH